MSDYLESKFLERLTIPLNLSPFKGRVRFSWWERLFAKRLVKVVKELEEEIRELKSKPVKWNRYDTSKGDE